MNPSKGALWTVVAIVVGVCIYGILMIRAGFSARERPSFLETVIARTVREAAIPARARREHAPFAAAPEILTDGRHHFADHCAICHANNGSGQTEMGQGLYPKPPDLRLRPTQDLTDGEIFYIIQNGIRLTGMPAWGSSHQAEDSWKLVLFIRHLPELTAEEEKDMERYNPGGAEDEEENHGQPTPPGANPSNGAPAEHHHH